MSDLPGGSAPTPPQRNPLARHLWWMVPTILLLLFLLCAGCCGGFYFSVLSVVRSSPVFEQAMQRLKSNAEVTNHTGTPLEATMFPFSGNVNVTPDSGNSVCTFKVRGPKGTARVHFEAEYDGTKWRYDVFDVTLEPGGEQLDLSDPPQ